MSRQVADGQVVEGTLLITDLESPLGNAVLQDTRLRLIAVLGSAECHGRRGYSLQELSKVLGCSVQNVHHHLRILGEHEAARVVRSEATQRIPRQFWVSDIRHICIRPNGGGDLWLELGTPAEGPS